MGRPKSGKILIPHSFSLTMDELAWLNKYPNASEKLRQLIDVVMTNTDVDLTLLSKPTGSR